MKKFTKYLVAGAFAACSAYASADPITVGGVTWDPDSTSDFTASFDFVQDFRNGGAELFGFGEIDKINYLTNFCNGCELTFELFGFEIDGSGGFLDGKGVINVYRDFAQNYDFSVESDRFDSSKATDGELWIQFEAQNVNFQSTAGDDDNPYLSGFLSVEWILGDSSALAFEQFATGTQIGGSDAYSTGNATFGITGNGAIGDGSLYADTVSAPSTVAIFGLSLLGLGAIKRRRNA
tara:strand:+ start:2952 stop:3659 length:708 start_codon:yes stop_codon:yes gene_type:complete